MQTGYGQTSLFSWEILEKSMGTKAITSVALMSSGRLRFYATPT